MLAANTNILSGLQDCYMGNWNMQNATSKNAAGEFFCV